jgi:hypothetical protein
LVIKELPEDIAGTCWSWLAKHNLAFRPSKEDSTVG